MFVGRTKELQFLNDLYSSEKAEFVTIYGRRRVGKTELITEFCKDKTAVFYSCSECTDKKQLSKYSDCIFAFNNQDRKYIRRFEDWEQAFSYIPNLVKDKKLVFVIDEFPYMVKGDKAIPSILQNLWDHVLSKTNVMLILSGSSISFMEDEILAAKNPLYGRMTGIYKLEPLPFDDAIKFFPDYSNEDKVITYGILGGIPHYLKQFDAKLSVEENVKRHILTKGSVLFNEVEYILHQELREPAAYNTILEAVAYGNSRYNEICERAQISSNNAYAYLKGLMEIGLISHEFPVMTSEKEKTKRNQGEYKISDNFFQFWYAYAYPYASELNQGESENIWELVIKNELHNFVSSAFEKISTNYLRKLNRNHKLPFVFLIAGRWWGKVTEQGIDGAYYTRAEEIDILATDKNKKNYIIGECKFTNAPFDLGQLKNVMQKFPTIEKTYYYLFSLNGFTDAVKELAANNDNVRLVYID